MEIKGKVHCMFEQSGTFKKEFRKLGYEAEDYDIQNNFGETDHVMDLFAEIDNAYDGKPSVFDSIGPDDLVMAFYPCIYFCATSQMAFFMSCINYRRLTDEQKISEILRRSANREEFYTRLIRFCGVAIKKGIRLIIENPWSEQTYLKANFIKVPDLVDMDRTVRGDFYMKPTAYWYWNCEPTDGLTFREREREESDHEFKRFGDCGSLLRGKEHDRTGVCPQLHLRLHPRQTAEELAARIRFLKGGQP